MYVPKTASKWSLQALIRSPVWDNGNFGNDVAVDDERLIIAANAFGECLKHSGTQLFLFLTVPTFSPFLFTYLFILNNYRALRWCRVHLRAQSGA